MHSYELAKDLKTIYVNEETANDKISIEYTGHDVELMLAVDDMEVLQALYAVIAIRMANRLNIRPDEIGIWTQNLIGIIKDELSYDNDLSAVLDAIRGS